LEFAFRYQQLVYNLDNARPIESDFERFKTQHADGKKSDVVPPVFQLPKGSRMPHAYSALFVGRDEELRKLARLLVPGAQGMVGVHATVTGLGGVGKTQLAIEYAHRYGKLYPGGVFWLNMEKAEEVINEVARCGGIEGMGLPGFDNITVPDQAKIVHQAWEDGTARLLVFDNAELPEAVETWRPKSGSCSVLITSRRQEWPPEMGVKPVALETLPREKSLEMLSDARPSIAQQKAEKDAAEKVCDRLGDLPLALSVAAAYLRKYKSEKVGQYLDALSKQPAILSQSLKKVGASFSVSYSKLNPEDEIDALAMRLFHLASHFAPVSISRELLAAAAKLNAQETEHMHRFEDALARLTDLGLVREEEEEAGRVSLHRLLREFARLRPPEGLTESEGREAVAQALLAFARRENRSGLPQKLARERPHLREAATESEKAGTASAANLYDALGFQGSTVALFQEAKADYERAVALGEAAFGNESSQVAIYVNNLGDVLQDLGDLEGAKVCYERALKIDETVYGPDHPEVAIEVNNLGSVLQTIGDWEGAKAYFERALKIDEAVYGLDHPNVAIHVNNLGSVFQDLGDPAGAKASYERALKIDEAVYGPEHPKLATRVGNLGSVLQDQGDLAGAKASYERALKIDESVYGPEHPKVAARVSNLGSVLRAQGDLGGAKACYERALKIDERVYGTEHPNVAICLNNLGIALEALCDRVGARASYERALAIFKKFLGDEHPRTKVVQRNLETLL